MTCEEIGTYVSRLGATEVAGLVGRSTSAIYGYLSGRRRVPEDVAERLRAAEIPEPITPKRLRDVVHQLGGPTAVAPLVGRCPGAVRAWLTGRAHVPADAERVLQRVTGEDCVADAAWEHGVGLDRCALIEFIRAFGDQAAARRLACSVTTLKRFASGRRVIPLSFADVLGVSHSATPDALCPGGGSTCPSESR